MSVMTWNVVLNWSTYADIVAVINKNWKKGDVVKLNLPMPVRRIVAIENVKDNQNRVALQRGPLVYCFEHSDNDGKVMDIVLPDKAIFKTAFNATLLDGIVSIQTQAPVAKISAGGLTVNSVNRKITAIPYFTWANRGKGQMQVWVPRKITNVSLSSK